MGDYGFPGAGEYAGQESNFACMPDNYLTRVDPTVRTFNIVEGEIDYSRVETLDDVKTTDDACALLMNDISSLANSGHLDDYEMHDQVRKYRDDRIALENDGFSNIPYEVFDSIARGWLRCDSFEHGDKTQLDILEGRVK